MVWGTILFLSGTLFTTGCHAPDLSSMKSSNQKFAVGIVGSQEVVKTKDFQDYIAKVFHDSGVAFDIRPVSNIAQAKESLAALANNTNIDLILTEASYDQTAVDLAKTHTETRIGVIGTVRTDIRNIRQVNVNKELQSFAAGYLAASVNLKQPVGAIVKNAKSLSEPKWKGLLEGIHFAGSSISPIVVTLDDVMTNNGLLKFKTSMPKIFIILDPVSEDQLARLQTDGKWLFSTQELPKMYPNVVAKPKPIFTEGVQEEIQALLNHSWQGQTSGYVAGTSFFDILRTEVLPGAAERMKFVEDGLRNRSIQPGNYEKPSVDETKSKPF